MSREHNNACRVRRTGRAVRIGEHDTEIEIGGRPVRVPNSKLARDIREGDEVVWRGSRWERTAAEA